MRSESWRKDERYFLQLVADIRAHATRPQREVNECCDWLIVEAMTTERAVACARAVRYHVPPTPRPASLPPTTPRYANPVDHNRALDFLMYWVQRR